MEITKLVSKSIDSYFQSLSVLGYRKQTDVDALIIYSFIEELLTGPMRVFITEDDYKAIGAALNCLQGTCLIPYQQYQGSSLFGDFEVTAPRITEDNNIRVTEDNITRFVS